MAGLVEDLRIAVRRLTRSPGYSLAAVTALALGIGFSSANYSAADVLLFRPVILPDLDRVIMLGGQTLGNPHQFRPIAATDYTDWLAAKPQTVESLAVSHGRTFNLTGAGDPVQIQGYAVTASFFDAMQLQPLLGRGLLKEEETPGKDRTVVLSYNLWERQFGSNPELIGQTIQLSGLAYTVAGVMPKGFTFPPPAEFWVPLALTGQQWADSGSFYLRAVARLRSGRSLREARAEFASLGARIAAQRPSTHARASARIELLRERISGDMTPGFVRITLCGVLFLLLVACLNVANLQFARVLGRTREMSIRTALGAPRGRLIRQFMVESLILAGAGGLLGLVVASWSLDIMKAVMPPEVQRWLPGWHRIGLNPHVLLWTALTALGAGILSGLGPAWWLSGAPAAAGLQDSSRSATGGVSRHRLRTIMVVAETALALTLVIGACLMVASFRSIATQPVTPDPAHVLTFHLTLPQSRYDGRAAVASFQSRLLERLTATAGVESAAVTTNLPYSDAINRSPVTFEGRPVEPGARHAAQVQSISPSFLRTLGVRLLDGSTFSGSEATDGKPVALVSETFARQFYPTGSPIGQRFHLGDGRWWTIIGVAADVAHDFTEPVPMPLVYTPYTQYTTGSFDVAVRTAGDTSRFIPAARAAVAAVDPLQPVSLLRSMRKLIDDAVLGVGYVASTLAVLSLVALFLAVLGVYSLMAYSVGERTREFGIRLALGDTPGGIFLSVLRGALFIGTAGIAAGLGGGYVLSRLVSGFLFNAATFDALAFIGMPVALALALAAASLLPAHRATRTDPLHALRHE